MSEQEIVDQVDAPGVIDALWEAFVESCRDIDAETFLPLLALRLGKHMREEHPALAAGWGEIVAAYLGSEAAANLGSEDAAKLGSEDAAKLGSKAAAKLGSDETETEKENAP